jgi:hypothetical protein
MKTCYAATRNKEVIADVLRPLIEDIRDSQQSASVNIVEVASGTGEHAALFKEQMPYLAYQPTEPDVDMHESITAYLQDQQGAYPVIPLDVTTYTNDEIFPQTFRKKAVHAMVCINMIHISPWECTEALFRIAEDIVCAGGFLLTYGPYR